MGMWVDISHILFVNDTSLFCGVVPNHRRNLWSLFLCFEAVSGLKTNLDKSQLLSVGNVHNLIGLAGILGCGVVSLSLKYLGLLFGATFLKR